VRQNLYSYRIANIRNSLHDGSAVSGPSMLTVSNTDLTTVAPQRNFLPPCEASLSKITTEEDNDDEQRVRVLYTSKSGAARRRLLRLRYRTE